jgi:hypothetical protein
MFTLLLICDCSCINKQNDLYLQPKSNGMLVERKEYGDTDGTVGYVECVFKSGNVLKTTYFPKSNRLYIAFNRGHTYSYANITPEIFANFESADSQGIFFQKNIANVMKYIPRKEFTLYPHEVSELKLIVKSKEILEENEDETDS